MHDTIAYAADHNNRACRGVTETCECVRWRFDSISVNSMVQPTGTHRAGGGVVVATTEATDAPECAVATIFPPPTSLAGPVSVAITATFFVDTIYPVIPSGLRGRARAMLHEYDRTYYGERSQKHRDGSEWGLASYMAMAMCPIQTPDTRPVPIHFSHTVHLTLDTHPSRRQNSGHGGLPDDTITPIVTACMVGVVLAGIATARVLKKRGST
jgi:hypothetical protein